MITTILATKLYIPHPRPNEVLRPRLIERLNEALRRAPGVTLISAPVGYGKTTLVSEWIENCRLQIDDFRIKPGQSRIHNQQSAIDNPQSKIKNQQFCWLSLDEGDSDPTRFLTYLVAALQTLPTDAATGVLGGLQTPQLLLIETVLTGLLNEITVLPYQFILVLDDYHLIDSQPVDQALTFLIEHLPRQMHLVITTREDPNLPLARLRARGQLTELRAGDLRFTPAEAAEFLNQAMGLNLSASDVAALEDRTEGWIAGLQLAALSTRGRENVHEFISSFAGDNRYIVDYLIEEVLQRQPEPVRSFLLQTAILERMNGPLCDAVIGNHPQGTGRADSSARLEALQRGNFFVVPLDDNRQWYRYHHLFAEVLYLHLMAEQLDQVATLHRRASEWYEHNGFPADAIRHALAGKDHARAADLIELAMPALRRNRQETTLLGWLKSLPDELLRFRPILSVHYAGALLLLGQFEGVETRLRDVERWLDAPAGELATPETPTAKMVVLDEEEFRILPGSIAMYRAAIALAQGDVLATMKYARRTLDLAPDDAHLLHGGAAGFLGLAYWTKGDLEEAHRSYTECMARLLKAGHNSDALGSTITLADLRMVQGRLNEAMSTYERGLQLAAERGEPALRGTADMYVGMSALAREHNDLSAAVQHLARSQELGELNGLPQNRYRWRVAMARIREAQGNLDGALDLLDEAERLYMSDFSPNVHPIAASKARLWVAQGRLGEAIDWAQEQGLSVEDNLSYLREFEHVTLARILLALYRSDPTDRSLLELFGFLERLLKAAQEGGRAGSAIEILLLQALARQALGDIPSALMPLRQALALAEPEGYVRMFLDEGEPMRLLIEDCRLLIENQSSDQNQHLLAYIDKLLSAFPRPAGVPQSAIRNQQSKIENLVEPLSPRELEILRLFKSELSGPQIADQLVIALSTVRSHTKSIFSKLNVNNRRAAVKRAVELGLM